MATEVKLPRLGQGMESGTIVKWLKGEGEPVKKREPLYELDTDKVTQEVEAEADGVLLKIVVPSGEVEVGRTIAFIGNEGEDVPSDNGGQPAETKGEEKDEDAAEADEQAEEEGSPADEMDDERERGRQAAAATAEAATAAVADAPATTAGRVKASPLARRLAREKGIDIAQLQGSGPEGRIVAEDVERGVVARPKAAPAATLAAATGEVEEIELTSTRKTIARRLTEAWQAPVFQLTLSVDMTRALELRERLVARLQEGETKPTVSDLLTKVCAAALVRHPGRERALRGRQDPALPVRPRGDRSRRAERPRRAGDPRRRPEDDPGDRRRPRRRSSGGHATASCSCRISRTARSRSRTSACSGSSSSSPSSIRRRPRSSPSDRRRRSRSSATGRSRCGR